MFRSYTAGFCSWTWLEVGGGKRQGGGSLDSMLQHPLGPFTSGSHLPVQPLLSCPMFRSASHSLASSLRPAATIQDALVVLDQHLVAQHLPSDL